MQNLKNTTFLTMKIKEKLFIFSKTHNTRPLIISQKIPFYFQRLQMLLKQTFLKSFFVFFLPYQSIQN